jgi:hypothetical protein
MKRGRTGKMGGRLTSQYKHSANFLGDDTIVNKSSRWWCKTRHKVATDEYKLMNLEEKAHCRTKNLEEAAICKPTQSALYLACFNSHFFCIYFFWKSLTFAWTTLSGFQSNGNIFLFYAPNFCLDRPFGFFSPPGRSLLPKPPFSGFQLSEHLFLYFFLYFFFWLWKHLTRSRGPLHSV